MRSFSFSNATPLWAGALPIAAIHVSYLIAASNNHVPWCNPYFDSCTSISATGRELPEFYWFKITMVISALIMIAYWRQVAIRQRSIGSSGNVIATTGTIAGIFLIVYVLALGIEGDLFRLQRRIGVILYFTLTYLAQLMGVSWLWRNGYRSLPVRIMLSLCILCLVIGVSSLSAEILTTWHDQVEDAVEWILALILMLYFIVSYWAWKMTDA